MYSVVPWVFHTIEVPDEGPGTTSLCTWCEREGADSVEFDQARRGMSDGGCVKGSENWNPLVGAWEGKVQTLGRPDALSGETGCALVLRVRVR